ncbi:gluconate 2-dehydrogenase subunit 3 family protein [Luteibacter sp. CQ10]|uniref:gluconate 2-dehydrogenase subunit 3 family protein n=1 Tax=Luteibacter sp. CQ10 TaxID=2805821 RepID=UPI0034A41C59
MKVSRYPGYDVLAKRNSPSWDAITRQVIEDRLRPTAPARFCTATEWAILQALCDTVVPRDANHAPIPTAALVDARLSMDARDGYRDARLPPLQQAWRIGLSALNAASNQISGVAFSRASSEQRTALVALMEQGLLTGDAWKGMPAEVFFKQRVLPDLCGAYYAHPHAWNDMGFGGPANPRGYVRLQADRRDPWEAIEAGEDPERVARQNRRVR